MHAPMMPHLASSDNPEVWAPVSGGPPDASVVVDEDEGAVAAHEHRKELCVR